MSGNTKIIEQWFKGGPSIDRQEDYIKELDGRLYELERILGEWYQSLQFGPIPGAYLHFKFTSFSPPQVGTVNDANVLPPDIAGGGSFELRPIFVGAAIDGEAEANLLDPDGNDIMVSDFVANPFFATNLREDFATDKIISTPGILTPAISLDIRSFTSGTRMSCNMICKDVSQVEP